MATVDESGYLESELLDCFRTFMGANCLNGIIIGFVSSHIPVIKNMADDDNSVSIASATSQRGERGVRPHIKKQLAIDIETNGGIKAFAGHNNQNLYKLLQSKVTEDDNPYGNRGDPIRTKLRKVVNRWTQFDREGKYVSEILNPWRIVQYSAREQPPAPEPSRPAPRRAPPRSNSDLSSSSSHSDSSSTSIAPSPVARKNNAKNFRSRRAVNTPPRQVNLVQKQPSPTPLKSPKMGDNGKNKRKFGGEDLDVILSKASKFSHIWILSNLDSTILNFRL